MGPLFSLTIAGLGLLALLGGVFAVLRFRHAPLSALGRAVLWVGGLAVGVLAAGVVAALALGAGAALHSSAAVSVYLVWLCMGGLAGGSVASRLMGRFAS